MRDYLFYNAGQLEARGVGRVTFPFRRLLRRLMLPFFQRLVALLQEIDKDLEQAAERQGRWESLQQERDQERETQVKRVQEVFKDLTRRQCELEAVHLDHEALVRRLAVLEDHVETLLRTTEVQTQLRAVV